LKNPKQAVDKARQRRSRVAQRLHVRDGVRVAASLAAALLAAFLNSLLDGFVTGPLSGPAGLSGSTDHNGTMSVACCVDHFTALKSSRM